MAGDADRRLEMPVAAPDGSGRNPREYGDGASSLAARTENSYPETSRMMDAVVERENTRVAAKSVAKAPMYYMNRRIRNRTYGGVRGRGRPLPLLLDKGVGMTSP